MVSGKAKLPFIILSDSEEDEEEEREDDDEEVEEDEEEEEESDDDDDSGGETSTSSSSEENSEWSGDDDDDDDEEEDEEEEIYEDENGESIYDDESGDSESNTVMEDKSQYDRIVQLLKGGRDLEILKLEECKVYLRKHGLRLTGKKDVCIQRIQEHWRIKDGSGEKLYPRSSFSINCTGDVCKGDVVVFTQKVFTKFDKVTRGGNLLGKRTIAGRVVKESYGIAKQQHTFTVEVLWSKGVKKLSPLSPLLVKGRNLYRLKTFRQRWDNEAERSKVLDEKHKRGAAARELRARNKARSVNKGSKRKRHSHHTGRSLKRRRNQERGPTARSERGNNGGGRGKTSMSKQPKAKKVDETKVQKSYSTHLMPSQGNDNRVPTGHTYSVTSHQLQNHPRDDVLHANRTAPYMPGFDISSATTAVRMSVRRPYPNNTSMPMLWQEHKTSSSNYHLDPPSRDYYNNHLTFARHVPSVPLAAGQYGGIVNGFLGCSTPGCVDLQAVNCVVFSCWRCCRRKGTRCFRHHNHT